MPSPSPPTFRRRIHAFLLLATVAAAAPGPIYADDCVSLRGARIFASRFGVHGLTMTLSGSGAPPARLFTFDGQGKEKTVWTARLANIPSDVYVAYDGQTVVTVASGACSAAREHALVVYGPKGAVLGDYRLDQILTAEEIRDHGNQTITSFMWAEDARFRFDRTARQVILTLSWGREIRVDAVTGRVVVEQ